MSRHNLDMRSPHLKYSRSISQPNTVRALRYGPGWVEFECLVRMTDQSQPVKTVLMCTNTRGHGTTGRGTRHCFRVDEDRFAVESGNFVDADGKPVNLPRMGLILTDVPASCAWLRLWEPPT